MADGTPQPRITLAAPIVEDFAYLARRMRPDEIAQHVAAHGDDAYCPNAAVKRFLSTPGPCWTFVGEDGLPVAAGGFAPLRRGVYEAWLLGTMERWDSHWYPMTRLFRRMIRDMLREGLAHRVQVTALASRTAAHEWYERGLGMQWEAHLKGYCADGQDAIMFTITKGDAP